MKRGSPRRSSPRSKGGVDTITSTPILAKKNVEETSLSRQHQHANKRRKRTQDSPRTPFDRDGSNSVGSDDVVDAEENAILEEEQLRREREAAEEAKKDAEWDPSKQNDDGLDDDEAVARPKVVDMAKYEALENEKFEQLNHLLDQTNLYSKFLSEQMDEIEQGLDAELEGSGGKKKGKKGKKGKKAAPMETQGHLLPLMRGGTLREYQMKGIKWILSLWQNGLNGILADQMGLGKTVQAIGFISHLWHKNIVGPFIVIAPLSTLSNWINEFKRWTPDIPVCLYHGNADERADIRMKALKNPGSPTFPVIVTSYEIAIRDAKPLQKFNYKYMVVDEGHRLKNFNCKLIRSLREFDTANKLLLTGTPLQNNLSELWSLLNFLLPDVFTSLADFEKWFDFSNVSQDDEEASLQHSRIVEKLHNILRPFLLRRLKADVQQTLPMKKEIILYPTMTSHQTKINRELLDRTLENTLKEEAKLNGGRQVNISKLRNILMQMRKNCNHPDLITGEYDGSTSLPSGDELIEQCGKMKLLHRLLTKLNKNGHKVLIFSQMTKMLDLLEVYLEDMGQKACRIDGGVGLADRRDAIDAFNKDPNFNYFLLSTRAGGLGINLASADTVVIYDSDWNPQQDLQAMDRCHRIGQTKPVLVFRMITANSVEENMLAKAESKLQLERLVIKNGAFMQDNMEKKINFSLEEMKEILSQSVGKDETIKGVDISDKELNKLLDRRDLVERKPIVAKKGKGYEVVVGNSGAGILSKVNA